MKQRMYLCILCCLINGNQGMFFVMSLSANRASEAYLLLNFILLKATSHICSYEHKMHLSL